MRVGTLDVSLRYAMDYDLWIRMARYYTFGQIDAVLSRYVVHQGSKTGCEWQAFELEWNRVSRRYWHELGAVGAVRIAWEYYRYRSHTKLSDFYRIAGQGDMRRVRSMLFQVIIQNPRALGSRGTWSIACQSIIGREHYDRVRSLWRT